MISAKQCRSIQALSIQKHRGMLFKSRIEKLDELIRDRINSKYNFRSLPLNGTGIGRLTDEEKNILLI